MRLGKKSASHTHNTNKRKTPAHSEPPSGPKRSLTLHIAKVSGISLTRILCWEQAHVQNADIGQLYGAVSHIYSSR